MKKFGKEKDYKGKRNLFKVALSLIGVMALASGFSGCKEKNSGSAESSSKSAGKKVIRVVYSTGNLCAAPLHFALESGLLKEEMAPLGYEVESVRLVEGGLTRGELIAAGKVDAGFDLIASELLPMENGLSVVFTTGVHTGCTKYYVKADSPIQNLADLKGKTVGVPNLSDSSVINLKRKVFKAGVGVSAENSEISFVPYGMADLPIALNNGAVDAIGIHDPAATKAEESFGFRKILDTGTDEYLKNEYCCQIFVTKAFLEKNPEAAAAWTRAIEKASAFVSAEPREAAQFQIDNDIVSGDLDFNARLLAELNYEPNHELGKQTLVHAVYDLKEAGILKPSTDAEKFISEHYVDLDNVPNSYIYEPETQTYKEVWE